MLTRKKVIEFLKDEKKASKVYKALSLRRLSKDEKRHYLFFKKMLKSRYSK